MSLPFGYRFLRNMATYPKRSLRQAFIHDYGKDLENCYDHADKTLYSDRIFCLDCPTFKACKGKWWKGCPTRAGVIKVIKGGKL